MDKIFEQADFNKSEQLLKDCYHELNRCISMRLETIDINDFYIGFCLRELINQWKHKVLVLFKLFVLEKRVLFYGSPVKPLCTTILSIISLHPLLSIGFDNNLNYKQTRPEQAINDDNDECSENFSSNLNETRSHEVILDGNFES